MNNDLPSMLGFRAEDFDRQLRAKFAPPDREKALKIMASGFYIHLHALQMGAFALMPALLARGALGITVAGDHLLLVKTICLAGVMIGGYLLFKNLYRGPWAAARLQRGDFR